MNSCIAYQPHRTSSYSSPFSLSSPGCDPYQSPLAGFNSPLGKGRPGIGQLLGGLVGAVLGQMMMPIPFLGAMMGAMIGASLGAMLDQMFSGAGLCCSAMMGQQYGPMNGQMGSMYGFYTPMPYCPPQFPNPPVGGYPRMHPCCRGSRGPLGLPQVSLFPFGNRQQQVSVWTDNRRPQVAGSLGRNVQEQRNVYGDNRGGQVGVSVVGGNQQRQTNVHGDNRSPQVATVVVGGNRQTQENVFGTNEGSQVAGALIGVNEQVQSNVYSDNQGAQVSGTVVGDNRQVKETVHGDNSGPQVAGTVAGTVKQEQTSVSGDNQGTQVGGAVLGTVEQRQATVSGDNEGAQVAGSVVGTVNQEQTSVSGDNRGTQVGGAVLGTVEQRQTTVSGDNHGTQIAGSVAGTVNQEQTAVEGDNQGSQVAGSVFGGVQQVSRSEGGADEGSQTGATVLGPVEQYSEGGAASDVRQTGVSVVGDVEQGAVAGDDSVLDQNAVGGGSSHQAAVAGDNSHIDQDTTTADRSTQEAALGSGTVRQEGAEEQTVVSLGGGPIDSEQIGGTDQTFVGSDHDDRAVQTADQGRWYSSAPVASADATLGGGNDDYEYTGNSSGNHVRLDMRSDSGLSNDNSVRIDTRGGNDTVVLRLDEGHSQMDIDLGAGNDRLVVKEGNGSIRLLNPEGEEIYRSPDWQEGDSVADVAGMDQLSVYRDDGTFVRWDAENGLQEGRDPGRPGVMNPLNAARTIREYAGTLDTANGQGSEDGIIGMADLRAAANDPNASPELREAAQYVLDNQAVGNALDASSGRNDRFTIDGLNDFIDSYETRPGYEDGPMDADRAAQVLNYHAPILDSATNASRDSRISPEDLEAIATGDNPGLPPELREAAAFMLENEQAYSNVANQHSDTARFNPFSSETDFLSFNDLESAAQAASEEVCVP